jgi:hypothetical protein
MKIVVMNDVLVPLFVRFKARIQLIGPGWAMIGMCIIMGSIKIIW